MSLYADMTSDGKTAFFWEFGGPRQFILRRDDLHGDLLEMVSADPAPAMAPRTLVLSGAMTVISAQDGVVMLQARAYEAIRASVNFLWGGHFVAFTARISPDQPVLEIELTPGSIENMRLLRFDEDFPRRFTVPLPEGCDDALQAWKEWSAEATLQARSRAALRHIGWADDAFLRKGDWLWAQDAPYVGNARGIVEVIDENLRWQAAVSAAKPSPPPKRKVPG